MCKPTIVDTICGLPVKTLMRPTPSELAGLFCSLSDEEQAEFFAAVHVVGETWRDEKGGGSPGLQWYFIGKHLAECEGACGADYVIEEMMSGVRRGREKRDAVAA
jgi:hypothetical protein